MKKIIKRIPDQVLDPPYPNVQQPEDHIDNDEVPELAISSMLVS